MDKKTLHTELENIYKEISQCSYDDAQWASFNDLFTKFTSKIVENDPNNLFETDVNMIQISQQKLGLEDSKNGGSLGYNSGLFYMKELIEKLKKL